MQAFVSFACCAFFALAHPASAQEPAAIRAVVESDLDQPVPEEGATEAEAEVVEEEDEGPKTFHADIDVGYGVSTVRFVSPADVVPALCPADEPCDALDFDSHLLHGMLSIGLGGFSIEGGLELPIAGNTDYHAWTLGVRVDTATDAWVSIQVRIAFLQREGPIEGMGARGSAGLVVRPFEWGALYGEAAADVTSVPQAMSDAGTLFAYSYYFGGGLRFSFWLF
jgi:hypothetical protein